MNTKEFRKYIRGLRAEVARIALLETRFLKGRQDNTKDSKINKLHRKINKLHKQFWMWVE